MAATDLQAPVLLLAMPQVQDPFFQRSVVLLVAHESEGSLGFILNRPTGVKVAEILSGMELEWRGDAAALAFFGGPVQPQLGTVLYAAQTAGNGGNGETAELLPGVAITQQVEDLSRFAAAPPAAFRLLLGYAGWGAGQLVEEILRNDWLIAPASSELVFPPDPERLWDEALGSVGIDPATLPSWTADDGESAN
jgi:putative transcriptional regulator